jgi:hypothetical protein
MKEEEETLILFFLFHLFSTYACPKHVPLLTMYLQLTPNKLNTQWPHVNVVYLLANLVVK